MLRRFAALWAAFCAALLALLTLVVVQPADASVPPVSLVTVHGFLTGTLGDPDLLVVNYTVTVQGGALTNGQLTTKIYPTTPVDLSTVQVDGTTVPSGTITRNGSAMTIRIGLGADSVNGGALGNGSYLVSYEQRRPTGAAPDAATSATLTFVRNGHADNVASNALPLTHPDLVMSIPRNSGEDQAAFLGTGRTAGYEALLTNRGAPADAVTLTIALPTGLRLDVADGVQRVDLDSHGGGEVAEVPCAHGGSALVTCTLGTVAHAADIALLVPVTATRSGKPGTSGTFHVSVATTGEPDQHSSNNSLSARVRFTGLAVLHVKLKASATKVVVGKSVTVYVSVHNDGPQSAGETFGLLIIDSQHFAFSKFVTNKHVPGPDYYRLALPPPFSAIVWNAGTIRAHHTAYAKLIMKAKSVGTTHVDFESESDGGDPGCDSDSGPCGEFAGVTLHAIKKK